MKTTILSLLVSLALSTTSLLAKTDSFNALIEKTITILNDMDEKNGATSVPLENSNSFLDDYKKITVPLELKKFFNDKECSQVLNKHYYVNCYDYDLKGSKYLYYKIEKDKVNVNTKERLQFYDDMELPKKSRTTYSDYTKNQYNMDRGHLASDANFDHNYKALESTYAMSNVVPMLDTVNRGKHSWLGLENYERFVANSLGDVEVLNIIVYSKNPRKLGRNGVSIPDGFGKIIFNNSKDFKRCFYVENREPSNFKLEELEIDCVKLGWK